MAITVIGWIALGLIAGLIANKLVNNGGLVSRRNDGLPMNILLGIVGAVFGGWIVYVAGATGMSLSLWSFLVAIVGAVAVLVAWQRFRPSHA